MESLDLIITALAEDDLNRAADIAETGIWVLATTKQDAAARTGEIGDAYRALRYVNASCVACHQSFQVK